MGGAGRTCPFTAEQLAAHYGEPSTYHRRFEDAVREAQARAVLLTEDAQQAVEAAGKVTW